MCIRDMKNKKVCTSYFFVQQGKQVCGTWQDIDAGKLANSGFVQAVDKFSLIVTSDREASSVADITFVCGAKAYRNGVLFQSPVVKIWLTLCGSKSILAGSYVPLQHAPTANVPFFPLFIPIMVIGLSVQPGRHLK